MTLLLAIDPGNCTGFAWFRGDELLECGVTTVDAPTMSLRPDRLVVELPQVYDAAHSKGDPNDLIGVAVQVGRWVERYRGLESIRLVKPATWKGQVPKEIHHGRILRKLALREQGVMPSLPKTKAHNMLDAVGLGMWALGRMDRGI